MPAAWTAPRTWVNNELVDANLMNIHLRDNLEFLDKQLKSVVILDDVRASGTTTQVIPFNTYVGRLITSEVFDPSNLVTLGGGAVITLQPGRYLIDAMTSMSDNQNSFLRLRNTTDSVDLINGVNNNTTGRSLFLHGHFSISSVKNVELQQYIAASVNVNGGVPISVAGRSEVYTRIVLFRLGDA
jgi:hypothetical protein